jgi:hypothetical protein
MSQYDVSRKENLLFSVMRQYMNMVMTMIMFIQAVIRSLYRATDMSSEQEQNGTLLLPSALLALTMLWNTLTAQLRYHVGL